MLRPILVKQRYGTISVVFRVTVPRMCHFTYMLKKWSVWQLQVKAGRCTITLSFTLPLSATYHYHCHHHQQHHHWHHHNYQKCLHRHNYHIFSTHYHHHQQHLHCNHYQQFLHCHHHHHHTVYFLFQNKHHQDDTYGLSFISRLVVLYSTCFELQGAHHQEFTFSTLYRQSLAYCVIFCCIPPILLRVLFPTEHVGGRVEYNKRLYSMPETACTV